MKPATVAAGSGDNSPAVDAAALLGGSVADTIHSASRQSADWHCERARLLTPPRRDTVAVPPGAPVDAVLPPLALRVDPVHVTDHREEVPRVVAHTGHKSSALQPTRSSADSTCFGVSSDSRPVIDPAVQRKTSA